MSKRHFLVLFVVLLWTGMASAQDAKTVLQNSVKAMGDVKSIQYSGTGKFGTLGQNYTPNSAWPELDVTSYTRVIDYASRSSREEMTRKEQDPPIKGGGAPFSGEQKVVNLVNGDYAWNAAGNAAQPQPGAAEEWQVQIWLTPHGFLKGALQNNATAKKGKGGTEISFMAGRLKVTGTIDAQNMVTRTETWIPNPVLGDMPVETTYSGYKDFNGVKFPAMIVQKQGGFPVLELTVSSAQANVPLDLPVPDAVRAAKVPPANVVAQKLADGVWWFGGATHNSVLVEYPSYLVMIDAPLGEERSLAIIAEAQKLVPNKPIKYLINTHAHFDHLGGVRTFIAEGIPVITNEVNKPFYEQTLVKAPHTLAPDKLSQSPRKATFIWVKDKYVLSDGGRSLEIYHVEGANHNAGLMMVYLPKEKILAEADDFTPGPPNAPFIGPRAHAYTINLYQFIQRMKLDVQTIAPMHGGVVPFSELQKAASS